MFFLNRLSPQQVAILGAFLGVLLTHGLNNDEQNVLGNFIATIGQTINTSAAQKENLQAKIEVKQEIENLCEQVECLKKKLKL